MHVYNNAATIAIITPTIGNDDNDTRDDAPPVTPVDDDEYDNTLVLYLVATRP